MLKWLNLSLSSQTKRTNSEGIKTSVKRRALSPAVTLEPLYWTCAAAESTLSVGRRMNLPLSFFRHKDICTEEELSHSGPKSQIEKLFENPWDSYLEGKLTMWEITNVTQLLLSFIQLNAHFKVEQTNLPHGSQHMSICEKLNWTHDTTQYLEPFW